MAGIGGREQVPVEEQDAPPESPGRLGGCPHGGPAQHVVRPHHLQAARETMLAERLVAITKGLTLQAVAPKRQGSWRK